MDCSSLITSDRLRYSLSLSRLAPSQLRLTLASLYRLIDSAFRVASYVLTSECSINYVSGILQAYVFAYICHVEGGEKTVASFSMPVQDQEGKTETKSRELMMMTSSFASYFPMHASFFLFRFHFPSIGCKYTNLNNICYKMFNRHPCIKFMKSNSRISNAGNCGISEFAID